MFSQNDINNLMGFIIFEIAGFYLIPILIVLLRNGDYKEKVIFINFLLGWTGFGWIIAFVLAVMNKKEEEL